MHQILFINPPKSVRERRERLKLRFPSILHYLDIALELSPWKTFLHNFSLLPPQSYSASICSQKLFQSSSLWLSQLQQGFSCFTKAFKSFLKTSFIEPMGSPFHDNSNLFLSSSYDLRCCTTTHPAPTKQSQNIRCIGNHAFVEIRVQVSNYYPHDYDARRRILIPNWMCYQTLLHCLHRWTPLHMRVAYGAT